MASLPWQPMAVMNPTPTCASFRYSLPRSAFSTEFPRRGLCAMRSSGLRAARATAAGALCSLAHRSRRAMPCAWACATTCAPQPPQARDLSTPGLPMRSQPPRRKRCVGRCWATWPCSVSAHSPPKSGLPTSRRLPQLAWTHPPRFGRSSRAHWAAIASRARRRLTPARSATAAPRSCTHVRARPHPEAGRRCATTAWCTAWT
mmetsp:Transcript_2470/g.9827  ORF Transcript_2470/g.9827 Transcript_2470/m.9827 type:complete len:203 (-) Transcript_2470:1650-2258(-)